MMKHDEQCWKNQTLRDLGVGGSLASCSCGLDAKAKLESRILHEIRDGQTERSRCIELEATNAALLGACEYALRETVRPSSDPLIKALKAAIRKATE